MTLEQIQELIKDYALARTAYEEDGSEEHLELMLQIKEQAIDWHKRAMIDYKEHQNSDRLIKLELLERISNANEL